MAKYFMSRLIYFQEPEGMKIQPESEISSHITLTSIISGLLLYSTLDIFTEVVCTRTSNSRGEVGSKTL